MKCIFIDSTNKSVSMIDVADFDGMKSKMGVRLATIAIHTDEKHDLFVDDEGLFKDGDLPGFTYEGYQSTLIGNGAVLGHDGEGNSTDASDAMLQEVRSRVSFTTMLRSSVKKILDTPPVVKGFDTVDELLNWRDNKPTRDILARYKKYLQENRHEDHMPYVHPIFVHPSLANQIATEIPTGHIRRETGRAMIGSHFTDFHDPFRPFFVGQPFECVWVESIQGPLFSMEQNGKIIPVNALMIWHSHQDTYLTISFADGMSGLASLITNEQGPENYQDSPIHSWMFGFFQKMAKKGQLGTQRVNERLRIGKGNDRKLVKIKDIVHIRLKTKKPDQPGESRDIEWSHRWEVMGHWRKVSGIGKDNYGHYCINGYTWVTAHVRGPEEKELVKKTRVVIPPKETQ